MKTVKNCKKGEIFQECFKQVEETQGTITVPWKMAPRGRYFKKYCQGRGTRFSSVQVYPGKCSSVDVWANDQSAVRYWRGTTHLGEKKEFLSKISAPTGTKLREKKKTSGPSMADLELVFTQNTFYTVIITGSEQIVKGAQISISGGKIINSPDVTWEKAGIIQR